MTEARTIRPLHPIALGLLVVLLVADQGGYDLLADPVGWLLVLAGTAALPADVPRRGALLGSAALALATSVALWVPDWEAGIRAQDQAILWALTLPQVLWSVLLCFGLAHLARADLGAHLWWRWLALAFVVVGAAPAVVYGAGVSSLEGKLQLLEFGSLLGLVVLLFVHAKRPWASRPTVRA